VSEIRETGRNTQGVRVIRLRDEEEVVDVEPVAEGEEVDEEVGELVDAQDPQEDPGN
jgi:DNA gyrase subunit A